MAQDGKTRGGIFYDEMDRGTESQGSTTACSNLSERDGKDQREGSPKQACSYWFARHSWLAIVARTSILSGTWPMLYCVSLALSVSRLDFVIWFRYFFSLLLPTYWFAVAEFRFFRVYMILMVVLLLLLILFPDGFLPCDHGLDFWDQLMWEFNF